VNNIVVLRLIEPLIQKTEIKTFAVGIFKCSIFIAGVMFNDFCFVEGDISKISFLPNADVVINLAAESHVQNSIEDSTKFLESNVLGVQNLLNLIKKKKNQPRFIHFSTDEVYGDFTEGSATEETLLNPSNPYSASKAAADMLINAWGRTHNLDYIIVRPSNNYGTRQHPEKLIPKVLELLREGKKIPLHDEGRPERTWLHVADTCSAVMFLLENGKEKEIYNISSPHITSNLKTVEEITSVWNMYWNTKITPELDLTVKRKGQDVRYSIDDSKLRDLGWSPERRYGDWIDSPSPQRLQKEFQDNLREILKDSGKNEEIWR